jgi:hypothetical protein
MSTYLACDGNEYEIIDNFWDDLEDGEEEPVTSGSSVDMDFDDPMDGDAQSALASCGWGDDEDYGLYEADPYEY